MILTTKEKVALEHFSKSSYSKDFIGLLKKIVIEKADVRNLKDCNIETVKGAQIACQIIETEIIQRLEINKNTLENKITEEYE